MTDIEYLKKYLPEDKLEEGLEQLSRGIPVQYIVGHVDFYGNIINVTKDVLIPRFETEQLVEKTNKRIKEKFNKKISILDLCTGSGCIAITLKKQFKENSVIASDISYKALDIANKNAKQNNVDIKIIHSDIFNDINEKFDVVISNPPYIAHGETIMEIVKNNEPKDALFARNNGLYFYEEILKNIKKYLNDKYLIAFEIGSTQGKDILNIAKKYLPKAKMSVEKDLNERDRFVFIENN